MPNADVKLEMKGGSAWNKMVKTDVKGHYLFSNVDSGKEYRITLLIGGAVKASINNVKTNLTEPSKLNFNLKKEKDAAAKGKAKKKHFVWVPGRTGSNMGGSWVEVDDATAGDMHNVKQASGDAMGRALRKN